MPPPKSVNIGPYTFPLTPGYSTGEFVIGAPEHEVLDAVRAERVRKKGFKVFEKLRARSGRRTLSEGELSHLTEALVTFDREVRLERLQGASPDASLSPRLALEPGEALPDFSVGEFDSEVTRLAELRIAAEEASRGAKLSEPSRSAALEALREDPLLREAARARIEAGLTEREKMLAELF